MQIIKKGRETVCITQIDYPPKIVKSMKQAGYKVIVKENEK